MTDHLTALKAARKTNVENVRLSFPNLRTKRASVPGGTEKFSANFIMDPNTKQGAANIAACKKAIAAAEEVKFGKVGVVKLIDDPKRVALRSGAKFKNAEGEVYAGYENMVAVACNSPKRPKLMSRFKELVELEDIEDKFYGGVYCDAVIAFYCVSEKEKGGRGLFCSVEGIRSREKGDPFGGGIAVTADDFADLGEEDDEDDGLGSASDEEEDLLA